MEAKTSGSTFSRRQLFENSVEVSHLPRIERRVSLATLFGPTATTTLVTPIGIPSTNSTTSTSSSTSATTISIAFTNPTSPSSLPNSSDSSIPCTVSALQQSYVAKDTVKMRHLRSSWQPQNDTYLLGGTLGRKFNSFRVTDVDPRQKIDLSFWSTPNPTPHATTPPNLTDATTEVNSEMVTSSVMISSTEVKELERRLECQERELRELRELRDRIDRLNIEREEEKVSILEEKEDLHKFKDTLLVEKQLLDDKQQSVEEEKQNLAQELSKLMEERQTVQKEKENLLSASQQFEQEKKNWQEHSIKMEEECERLKEELEQKLLNLENTNLVVTNQATEKVLPSSPSLTLTLVRILGKYSTGRKF
eukprot:TRINITY_DN3312_c0_g1_i7.p1 TRINITY_DN3312_c0_g1~~TRINITY_DN3312_c0_g1_i7.p1  ORF type:complete len:364 (+),score=92.00 TRINITY_DN3312_c0_g1_i7:208-1299(+)